MPPKDNNKKARDLSLNSVVEEKLLNSLHASMLFFVFDHVCSLLSEESDSVDDLEVHREFFKEWKNFANAEIIQEDIKIVNKELNTDFNIFSNILKGDNYMSESTELYQEKYYSILSKIEKNFFRNFKKN
jgi:hypothetical protein